MERHIWEKKIVPVIPKVDTLFFYLKIQLYESELRKCDREIICCWITQRWLQRSPLGPHQRQAFLLAHSLGCSGQNKWAIFCFPRPLLGGCFKNGAVGTWSSTLMGCCSHRQQCWGIIYIYYFFILICVAELQWERREEFPFSSSLSKYPQQPDMSQSKANSFFWTSQMGGGAQEPEPSSCCFIGHKQ